MSVKNIIRISLIFSTIYFQLSLGQKTIIQIDTLERCKCAKKCIMPKFESVVRRYNDNNYIDSVFELTEDIRAVKLGILPIKCKVKESLDTCERESRINVGDACGFLQIPGAMWSSFVYTYSPPFKCPLKKGTYVGKNGSLSADIVVHLVESYWRAEAEFYSVETNEYLWSFCVGFQVATIR